MTSPVFSLPAAGPSYVQVTSTGDWAKATVLRSGLHAERFLARLGDPLPSALGVELLWEGPPICFVGARLDGPHVGTLAGLVETLIADPRPLQALAALSNGELGPVLGAQCGAINAWSAVEPMTLWDGNEWRDPSSVMDDHPRLRDCAYPVGLEVGHRGAYYAIEISRPTDGGHAIDVPALNRLAILVKEGLTSPPTSSTPA